MENRWSGIEWDGPHELRGMTPEELEAFVRRPIVTITRRMLPVEDLTATYTPMSWRDRLLWWWGK